MTKVGIGQRKDSQLLSPGELRYEREKKRPHILFAATETVKKEEKKMSVNLITVQNQNTDLFHLHAYLGKTKLRTHFLNKALQIALWCDTRPGLFFFLLSFWIFTFSSSVQDEAEIEKETPCKGEPLIFRPPTLNRHPAESDEWFWPSLSFWNS